MRQWCNEKERHITDRDISSRKGTALQADADYQQEYAGDELDREQRSSLKRVPNLSTELQDITEVEYRKLRLENVVLVGIWTSGTAEDAEVSLRELAALAETAGSVVLAGVLQRRDKPDNATYLGSGKAREVADLVASTGADTIDSWSSSFRRTSEGTLRMLRRSRSLTARRLSSIFLPSTPSPERVRPRWNSPSSNTCFRDCAAGVNRCPVRRADASAPVTVSAPVAPVRPRLSLIVGVFATYGEAQARHRQHGTGTPNPALQPQAPRTSLRRRCWIYERR